MLDSILNQLVQNSCRSDKKHLLSRCYCCCSVGELCLTLCDPMDCSAPGFPVLCYLPEFAQIFFPLTWWCHLTISSSALFSICLQSFPASGSFPMSWLFASGGQRYWSFSFIISPSNEYSGLISVRKDLFDLLAAQGTLKSLLQHCSSKASTLQCSAFFTVQLSHPWWPQEKP